tara:strand:+ start:4170 stop:5351 length:1182 start_codon:yes stop_codon:yes gene_type:complete
MSNSKPCFNDPDIGRTSSFSSQPTFKPFGDKVKKNLEITRVEVKGKILYYVFHYKNDNDEFCTMKWRFSKFYELREFLSKVNGIRVPPLPKIMWSLQSRCRALNEMLVIIVKYQSFYSKISYALNYSDNSPEQPSLGEESSFGGSPYDQHEPIPFVPEIPETPFVESVIYDGNVVYYVFFLNGKKYEWRFSYFYSLQFDLLKQGVYFIPFLGKVFWTHGQRIGQINRLLEILHSHNYFKIDEDASTCAEEFFHPAQEVSDITPDSASASASAPAPVSASAHTSDREKTQAACNAVREETRAAVQVVREETRAAIQAIRASNYDNSSNPREETNRLLQIYKLQNVGLQKEFDIIKAAQNIPNKANKLNALLKRQLVVHNRITDLKKQQLSELWN